METPTGKAGHIETMSVEKVASTGNLTLLAQAAAAERALTPLQAMRTYWRAFFWCIFMSIGALVWGYDIQVCLYTLTLLPAGSVMPSID